jgi:hypothetical protein
MRSRVAVGCVALLLVSCGGSPPTVAPTVSVPPPPKPAVAPAEPVQDVSAVPAPAGLSFTVHLAHPRATIQQLTGLLGSLAALFSGGGSADPEALVAMAAGAPIGKLVDLDQPVDLAVSDVEGEGATKIAGSALIADPAAARETLEKFYKWTPTAPGVVRLEPRDDAPDGASPRPCMLTPAFDPHAKKTDASTAVGARIVCGATEAAVRHLGPYLARTMPRVTSDADFRLEVFFRELQAPKKESRELGRAVAGSTPDAGRDPAEEVVDELADKLTDDVGTVVLEASSDGKMLDLTLTTGFTSATSAITRAMLAQAAPAAAPPPAFERLPREASFAWYGRGAPAADLAPLRGTVFEGLRRWLVDEGFSASAIDAEMAPLQKLMLTGGPWVIAAGHKVDAARAAVDAAIDHKTPAARAKARTALQGWVVAGVEEPPQAWMDGVRDLVKNDGVKPTGKPQRKHEPQKESWKFSVAPLPPALGLPAGTLHVEDHVTQNPEWVAAQRKAKLPLGDAVVHHVAHLFVVPDGTRTWFAAAEDPALAAAEVRASLGGAAQSGTLASRPDLDGLRELRASSAGYLSVAGIAMWLVEGRTDEGLKKARETMRGLAGLTAGGTTPVPVGLTAAPKPGGGPSEGGELRLRVVFPLSVGAEVVASPASIF